VWYFQCLTSSPPFQTVSNVDRTVHFSEKAVDPPGEARSDLDIWLDYAHRMDLRDKDGFPLITWNDAESAFEAWKACSKGHPCDYSGLSYEKMRGRSGIQWPVTEERPDGTPRLYTDATFLTDPDVCESYTSDLLTGAPMSETEYRAMNPAGRAFLRPAEYLPPHEEPDDDYPLAYTTGRTVYHFHTRTKTDRAPQLHDAAPAAWVEISSPDAQRLGIQEGDMVRVESRRGLIEVPARVGDIKEGIVFAPFHYGYFDTAGQNAPDGHPCAANELTITEWDPVSKQPYFKIAAVRLTKIGGRGGRPALAPTTTGSAPASGILVPPTVGGDAAEATSTLEGI